MLYAASGLFALLYAGQGSPQMAVLSLGLCGAGAGAALFRVHDGAGRCLGEAEPEASVMPSTYSVRMPVQDAVAVMSDGCLYFCLSLLPRGS